MAKMPMYQVAIEQLANTVAADMEKLLCHGKFI